MTLKLAKSSNESREYVREAHGRLGAGLGTGKSKSLEISSELGG